MRNRKVIIGTRGSTLAQTQAAIVANRLQQVRPDVITEVRVIVTTGDRDQKSHLSEIGGKGIFIRELEQALLDESIDLAVHSFKDVTSQLASGLQLSAFLCPESVRDVLVSFERTPLNRLPEGARIGTGSMRRKTLLLRQRRDLCIAEIRGNIDTRIAKVDRGEYDGVMLSEAGLIRLHLDQLIAERFDPARFYPAPGQGVITIETRNDDVFIHDVAMSVGDSKQFKISTAELALLAAIGFDCRTPLGIYTTLEGTIMTMSGFYAATPDCTFRECSLTGTIENPAALGNAMALRLLRSGE